MRSEEFDKWDADLKRYAEWDRKARIAAETVFWLGAGVSLVSLLYVPPGTTWPLATGIFCVLAAMLIVISTPPPPEEWEELRREELRREELRREELRREALRREGGL